MAADSKDLKPLAQRVAETCQRSGLSKRELARRTGVSEALIANWARGSNVPNGEDLGSFIRVTRVNGHWLLTGEGAPDLLIIAPAGIVSAVAPVETPTPRSTVRARK